MLNWFGNPLTGGKPQFDTENILRQENLKRKKFEGNERSIIELDFSFIPTNQGHG